MTSDDIVEMRAFESLEPFGALHFEAVSGAICAAVSNAMLKKTDGEPFKPSDFMPALARAMNGYADPIAAGPILLDDPEAQSALIKASVFGVTEAPHG